MGRPFAWERSYPPGLDCGAPIPVTTLPRMLDRAAEAYGGRPFIEFRGRRVTFDAFRERADRMAARLRALGVGRGTPVALLLPNVPWHPVAFFAVLRAGGRVVHLSPLDPSRSLARKLEDSGARIAVTTDLADLLPRALALLDGGGLDRLVVGADAEWGGSGATLPVPRRPGVVTAPAPNDPPDGTPEDAGGWPEADPADVAVLQYTGGTTGQPRAAMLTHANLSAATAIYERWFDGTGRAWREGDRVLGVLPLFHIYMLTTVLLRCLVGGVEILLRERFDAAGVLDDIEHGRATSFSGVPTMFIAMAAQPGIEGRDLSSLRVANCGGAPLPPEVAHRFEALTGRRVGGGWGMTETSPAGTGILPGTAMRPGLIGLPLPGIEMDVAALDDPHRVLVPGEVGELRIRGPNVTAGYWQRPEETAAAFADGFLLTGDVGFMDEAGDFHIVDRKKDMLISGGFNVYPRAIEDAIYEHAAVEECAVVGVDDAYRGQAAKAFVRLRAGAAPFTLEALRLFLADRLGRHELPAALEFRDALPRTPVGKLSRRELAEEERARAASAPQPSPEPSTPSR